MVPVAGQVIQQFQACEKAAPGHSHKTEKNLKAFVAQRLKRTHRLGTGWHAGSLDRMGSFSLCQPAVHQDVAIVATDCAEDADHFLMCIDLKKMDDLHSDPLATDPCLVKHHIRSIRFMASDAIVCAQGQGDLAIYSFDQSGLFPRMTIPKAHAAEIRQVAVNLANPTTVASGGFDHKLCIWDLGQQTLVDHFDFKKNGIIGSVKWPLVNQSLCLSCTLDNGQYNLFDLRSRMSKPAVAASWNKPLYTHERYTDYHVLLGFADGTIKYIDMRAAHQTLTEQQDPYVDCIGGLGYNGQSKALVVSGYTDFSVWKLHSDDHKARLWSHSENHTNVRINTDNLSFSATWTSPTTVLTSSSCGCLGLYVYDGFSSSGGE